MAATVTVDVVAEPGLDLTARNLIALGVNIKSFREPLKRSARRIGKEVIGEAFESEGPGWEPLADSTVAKKGKDDILVDSGQLQKVAQQLNAWEITQTQASFFHIPMYGF